MGAGIVGEVPWHGTVRHWRRLISQTFFIQLVARSCPARRSGEREAMQAVMLWMITLPYAVSALYWFLFYPFYPKDVEARQDRGAQASAQGPT